MDPGAETSRRTRIHKLYAVTQISKQWGGDISGGVVPLNVKCVQDAGRTVLALEAHGDTFTGTGPIGVKTHGSHGGANFPPTVTALQQLRGV